MIAVPKWFLWFTFFLVCFLAVFACIAVFLLLVRGARCEEKMPEIKDVYLHD